MSRVISALFFLFACEVACGAQVDSYGGEVTSSVQSFYPIKPVVVYRGPAFTSPSKSNDKFVADDHVAQLWPFIKPGESIAAYSAVLKVGKWTHKHFNGSTVLEQRRTIANELVLGGRASRSMTMFPVRAATRWRVIRGIPVALMAGAIGGIVEEVNEVEQLALDRTPLPPVETGQ